MHESSSSTCLEVSPLLCVLQQNPKASPQVETHAGYLLTMSSGSEPVSLRLIRSRTGWRRAERDYEDALRLDLNVDLQMSSVSFSAPILKRREVRILRRTWRMLEFTLVSKVALEGHFRFLS